jgi:hypothetical protein
MKLTVGLTFLIFSMSAFPCYRFRDVVVKGKKTSEIETIKNWGLEVSNIIKKSISENFVKDLKTLTLSSEKSKEEYSRNKLLSFFTTGQENIFFIEGREEGTSKVFISAFSASEMINLEVLLLETKALMRNGS